jgi:DNA-binding XRE family transcriptional regulator
MKPHEIKVEIYRRRPEGLTITSIAKSLGVSKQAVALIIERRQTSARIAQAVAAAIERPLEEVFPELAECADRRRAACN